jgi:GNAT superfamily N-acetyltransferase
LPELGRLPELAAAEGHHFVDRAVSEWRSDMNRFDQPGEAFYVAYIGVDTAGMCGLNIDPFLDDPRVGRVRHLYVAPECRRRGVGRRLVGACLELAVESFDRVRLRTFDLTAATFYEAVGFEAVVEADATHTIAVT